MNLQNLERKIQLLEDRLERQKIVTGSGLVSSKDGDTFSIDLAKKSEQEVNYHPFRIMTKIEGNLCDYSIYGGTVNNILPSNWSNFASVETTKSTQYYVYWLANFSGNSLTSLRVNISESDPIRKELYAKNSLPQLVTGLIGIVRGDSVLYQFAKRNIHCFPRLAMTVNSELGQVDNYYEMSIDEL